MPACDHPVGHLDYPEWFRLPPGCQDHRFVDAIRHHRASHFCPYRDGQKVFPAYQQAAGKSVAIGGIPPSRSFDPDWHRLCAKTPGRAFYHHPQAGDFFPAPLATAAQEIEPELLRGRSGIAERWNIS